MQENETKKYNKIAYNSAYNKEKYKQMKLYVKPETFDLIQQICQDVDISKNEFMVKSALYIINNNLLDEIK